MANKLYSLYVIVFTVLAVSCLPEPDITTDPRAKLAFSADTLRFDTLFTRQGSISKRLRIYNFNNQAVEINQLSLARGNSSPYRIYLNGQRGSEFNSVIVPPKDSLYLVAEVTIDPRDENLPFLVKDSLLFLTNGNLQQVKLVAWGQSAHFLKDTVLACNTTFTAEKPYVLQGQVLVDTLCDLTIEPGARIYGDNGALFATKGRILAIGDTAENRIIFSSVRQDENYRNYPGQWFGILILQGSEGNVFEHVEIRNAQFGVRLQTLDDDTVADITLRKSKIENMSAYGIYGFNADVEILNSVIDHCALGSIVGLIGGNYQVIHSTIAYYSSIGGLPAFRADDQTALQFSDNITIEGENIFAPLNLTILNSIIWGESTQDNEFTIFNGGFAELNILISHSLIKSDLEGLDINSNILNQNPRFVDRSTYDFRLDSLSPAIGAGVPLGLDVDLRRNPRSEENPDLGAYERLPEQ